MKFGITAKVLYNNSIPRRINGFLSRIHRYTLDTIDKSLNDLITVSNDIVYIHKHTYSHGWDQAGQSIRDNWVKEITEYNDQIKATLKNTSPHAAAVEFGTVGPITPKHSKMLKLGPYTYVPEVAGQPGYHYLEQAVLNLLPTIKEDLMDRCSKAISVMR